ncbi:hypothetical protein [Roseibacillus persicicus]|uniref:hypothetical protein n=2 Tax=Roseibacillus persicicus TaxID=454148 RepID=UPI00366D8BCE
MKEDKLMRTMSWRLDWVLLATGLISLGLTMIQKGRTDLLSLLGDEGDSVSGLLASAGGLLVPISLLAAFVGRLGWRVVTRTWR